jgi:hypothetical protein
MRTQPAFYAIVLSCTGLAAANPVITEIMASNQTTAADEDGEFSDWVEVHNPTTAPVSLNDWYLTDSSADLKKWRFPNVTLAPGEFRLVWASGKNRRFPNQPLHTNFSLSAGGEYLALVQADGTTVAQQFSPEYPELAGDESYGARFQSTVLVAPGATTRYRVPTSNSDPAATWVQPGFADAAWSSGPSGLGHGLMVPGVTIRHVFKNGAITGLTDAVNLASLAPGNAAIQSEATVTAPVLNLLGDGSEGHFSDNAVPPAGSGDNYVIRATGFIEIPASGTYTFGMNSDDGGRIRINNVDVVVNDSFQAPTDRFGSRTLNAGIYPFEVIMFEGTGGDSVEFFAAAGSFTTWNANEFHLVGDTANGGLAAFTLPEGSGSVFATNLQSVMAGKQGAYFRTAFSSTGPGTATAMSLVTRHNDGFAAWLNGTKVASDNVPATPDWNSTASGPRSNSESLRRMGFNVTAHLPLLANGNNVLAIHGMKDTANDSSFLILPELIAGYHVPVAPFAFYRDSKASPGWINGAPSSLGRVADTQFSVKRGYFTASFPLAITSLTPGATIRYTLDGSTPSATHGLIYTAPLTISSTTVLRACAVLDGWESTDVDTQTYLFLNDVITQSSTGAAPPGWPVPGGAGQVYDYGMDPDIVTHANPDLGGQASVKAALAALPAVSITTDLPNLFNIGGSQGIYSNPNGRGYGWERPASLEWINPPDAANPNGTGEFQINAGLRLRGGYSRSTDNPKHSFRMFFRSEYGDSKLLYPLFGRYGSQEFDQIDFRTAQNYSWSFAGDDNNTFLREEATRQAQLDMGQPGSHVRYFHLFLNGQYWGLYNLDERTEADFAETYFGGDSEDYDVIKAEQTANYSTAATDGNLNAWQDLWNKSKAHRASPTNANYFRMMGLGANGVTPTADPVLLDPDNLIDYLLLTFWTGNLDGCTSGFLGNERANNWFGSRRRDGNPGQGFRFFAHDFEHTFFNVNEDRTGPYTFATESNFAYSNPLFLHQDLAANAEYRMRWADRIHKHLFNGGAFTPAAWQNRVNKLAGHIDQAIIAESARWGDAKSASAKTRLTWLNAQATLLNYLPQRTPVVLSQLRNDSLYPSIDAPVVTPFGGYQNSGVEAVIAAPSGGTLHYMADGSDPRAIGGALKAGALTYTSATTNETLVPWSATNWKYLADGTNQGTAWRASGFNDSAWPTGTAELGYSSNGEQTTTIPITEVSPGQKVATCYFRRSFTVTNPGEITNLSVTVEYDDAYAVYLNGTRIAGNLPVDPAYNYYTGNAINDLQATTQIDPARLSAGNNVIAVEIHQASGGSSDLSMNLSLAATRSNTPSPLFLTGTGERKLRVRALNGATWSALNESTFLLDTEAASPANLAISEILYHPADPSPAEVTAGFTDANDFEFIELLNTGTRHVDLDGVYLYGAVTFNFTGAPTGRTLAPGARLLVVANRDAFQFRYGSSLPVAGQYSGQLNNAGENLVLYTPGDAVIRGVNYEDAAPWPVAADGTGVSLVRRHPAEAAGDNDPAGWAVSGAIGGSPGSGDTFAPGTFDAWVTGNFNPAQLASSATSGLSADPDGDGRSNVEEYAFATQPLVPDQPDADFIWNTVGADRHAAVRIRRPDGATDVLYELLSNDGLDGEWTVIESIAAETMPLGSGIEHAVFRDPAPAGIDSKFLRVRATWQP